ncbi:MAG: DUF429 domain-containing protein [Vulcanisaeta sp.]|jgi:predicted nuclease with RNAse H fold|nr:MAG: hypothetical protein AT716_03130 [Vulcanisaeta sp. MG_3]KUO94468.1 MAG: hypothetical protein AT717_00895 [Vulcanisaeta sp. CIS_19]MCG2865092.1 DUF429 domain-containing protein [Vulcanisaeta sp.]MCG2866524.1 DUF429 domain-containing protein [Vulcanisaeta sp.]MCG2885624.1 DUF429 domain-containing protein [Vulcanisaeta sp.]
MGNYVGLDLALPGRRRTGFGLLDEIKRIYDVKTLSSRHEVIKHVVESMPKFVCIDAPLGLPRYGINRLVEIEARRRGLRLIPPLLGSMKSLTMYGMEIASILRKQGIAVLEVHPTSTLKILNITRQGFLKMITSTFNGPIISNKHELDALVAAFTCLLHDRGCTEELIGYEGEGSLVIPQSNCTYFI